ncbi:MAG: D-alanyl-D-alanine carboxypeptidase [Ruminococcaceae bacterium]|nr:D-alanyl-D-alanine carboxypeptidase [Oscillospiraceae bacterium]
MIGSKPVICFILVFVFFFSTAMPVSGSSPGVSARSYCLMDKGSGKIICEGNSSERLPMASTTKIMTALLVIRNYDVDKLISIPSEAVGVEGSSIYLSKGEKLSVKELLYALMLESANDAAVALAVGLEGSVEAFCKKMNALAGEIGMSDTVFKNPHGLPCEGHYSTARDMALLMCEAMNESLFCTISSCEKARISAVEAQSYRYLSNHNRLLDKYEYCIGGKTGFTKAAGRCLVTAAKKSDAELVCVTLSAHDDWNDHISLFEYGFSLFSKAELCREKELEYELCVVGGIEDSVKVTNRKALFASLLSSDGISVEVELPRFVYAPVKYYPSDGIGEPLAVGRAVYYQNGRVIGSCELYVCDAVGRYEPPSLWERILRFFGFIK